MKGIMRFFFIVCVVLCSAHSRAGEEEVFKAEVLPDLQCQGEYENHYMTCKKENECWEVNLLQMHYIKYIYYDGEKMVTFFRTNTFFRQRCPVSQLLKGRQCHTF